MDAELKWKTFVVDMDFELGKRWMASAEFRRITDEFEAARRDFMEKERDEDVRAKHISEPAQKLVNAKMRLSFAKKQGARTPRLFALPERPKGAQTYDPERCHRALRAFPDEIEAFVWKLDELFDQAQVRGGKPNPYCILDEFEEWQRFYADEKEDENLRYAHRKQARDISRAFLKWARKMSIPIQIDCQAHNINFAYAKGAITMVEQEFLLRNLASIADDHGGRVFYRPAVRTGVIELTLGVTMTEKAFLKRFGRRSANG